VGGRLSELGVEKLRYGRARLTVARSGPLTAADRLGDALDAYEKGEARPAVVANAYLRARVVDHSPSFRWRGTRLGELIPLVTSVAEPAIEAETSRELADELVRLRRVERATKALDSAGVEPAPVAPRTVEPPAVEPPAVETLPDETALPEPSAQRPAPARTHPAARRPASAAVVRRRRLVLLGSVAVVVVAGFVLVANYLSGAPDRLADDYREGAGPAVKRVADSMDIVYNNFDLYLAGYEIGLARGAIKDARTAIREQRPLLAEVPDAPLIGAGDADDQIEAASASGDAYLDAAARFLNQLDRFLELDAREADAKARQVYERTIELAEEAETLEEAIFSLGTGDGDPAGTDHYRPATPVSLDRAS